MRSIFANHKVQTRKKDNHSYVGGNVGSTVLLCLDMPVLSYVYCLYNTCVFMCPFECMCADEPNLCFHVSDK